MSDNSFGSDLSFLNKKVKPDRVVHIPPHFCFDKQACRAQVSDSRGILTSLAMPVDPDSVGLFDSRVAPSPRNTVERQESLTSAYVRPQTHVPLPCGFAVTEIRVAHNDGCAFRVPAINDRSLKQPCPCYKNLNGRRVLGISRTVRMQLAPSEHMNTIHSS